jgi:hypothetical protein
MNKALRVIAMLMSFVVVTASVVRSDDKKPASDNDKELAADLKLLQGSWEQTFGNDGTGKPTIRLVKTIEGNTETRREYVIKTGEVRNETIADFKLSKSGDVRVFTFHFQGTPDDQQLSYVYSVDKKIFYDVPGLLHGEYRNYRTPPQIFRWKRIPKKEAEGLQEKNKADEKISE